MATIAPVSTPKDAVIARKHLLYPSLGVVGSTILTVVGFVGVVGVIGLGVFFMYFGWAP